jgi:hypothetical protein
LRSPDVNAFSNHLSETVLHLGVLDELLDELGFEYRAITKPRETKYVGPCPIHGGDDPDHCVV